LLFWLCSSAG